MKTDELFRTITDRIVAQMEAGVRPWARPWSERTTAADYALPHNIAGRPYRGANMFWLAMAQSARGYTSPVWLTFNQAKKAGGNVKKGEVGTPVFFWKFDEKVDPKTKKKTKTVWAKGYTVFNIAQVEGVKVPARRERTAAERHAEAEALMASTGADIHFGGNRACFIPALDMVQLPVREAFKAPDFFYATAFHELGHWTGHKTRLDREFGKRFGDQAYAFEELVAELTAAFVTGTLGLANPEREDHAAYLTNWLQVLKGDPKAFITAAGKAQAAADYILAKAEASDEDVDADHAEAA
jgi:antirestriction protein ArdC